MSVVWVIRVFVIPGVFFINMAVIMVLLMMISLARRAGQVVGGISGPDLWPDSIATGRLCPALMNRLLINLYPTILHFALTIKWECSAPGNFLNAPPAAGSPILPSWKIRQCLVIKLGRKLSQSFSKIHTRKYKLWDPVLFGLRKIILKERK